MASPFRFGDFDYICEHAALVVCPMVGTAQGTMPTCYARNVQLGSQIIFQPGTRLSSFHPPTLPFLILPEDHD